VIIINARNVQQALPEALYQLNRIGLRRDSRNGPVIMFPEPVTTVYDRPQERVLFWAQRDANPFFHLMESLWMLAGRNDVEWIARYLPSMAQYSDDGKTFHGAYGYRWRRAFGEQLDKIAGALAHNRDDRRQVLSMWDANIDLGRTGKDIPCNLQVIFQITPGGDLDMMVTNRSNDLVWGAYGANAVHFSYLHEYMALRIGRPVGKYRQVSANLHVYADIWDKMRPLAEMAADPVTGSRPVDPYEAGEVSPFPLMSRPNRDWQLDLSVFMDNPDAIGFQDPFFRKVAGPMARAHRLYKDNRLEEALEVLETVGASDWRLAGKKWIKLRLAKRRRAADDGVNYEE
jgi:hypothetical protein